VRRSLDPKPHIVSADPKDLNLYLIPDDELFVFLRVTTSIANASAFPAGPAEK
jgi:hypothetical protein